MVEVDDFEETAGDSDKQFVGRRDRRDAKHLATAGGVDFEIRHARRNMACFPAAQFSWNFLEAKNRIGGVVEFQ